MSTKSQKTKVVVILGPTASGKTALATKLAYHYQGEIISADSRQVYQGLDIGSGKDLAEYEVAGQSIPYHLIDVISPQEQYSVADYQAAALKALAEIKDRNKLPIIVGGSGLYLQAVLDNFQLTTVKPDLAKRAQREALGAAELWQKIFKLQPEFAKNINDSDRKNPRRLARYLEIVTSGQMIKKPSVNPDLDFLLLGLEVSDEEMRHRISQRLLDRLNNQNLVGEVEKLVANGLSWQRLNSLGLEYRYLAWYLQGKLDYEEMIEQLTTASYRFAKRQKTWFRRLEKEGKQIHWIKDLTAAKEIIDHWLE
ncbi:MAG: tRNA (adenosine(37)-N6)-dimethylallyltransferase MiaA [Patescibacteria group bacterium]|jgi:tRNA dimethylallyltransferase